AIEVGNDGKVIDQRDKTTRLTAFLTPGHAKLGQGGPTVQGTDPIGWKWVLANEVRSAKSARISHWVRFHLLNATLGGKGYKELHLVPADKSANANWESQIERPMKAALKSHPVYYDVEITYYTDG